MIDRNRSLRPAAELVSLVAVTLAAYANTLHAPLFFDDTINIVKNPAVRSLANFTSLARLVDASAFSANLKYAAGVRPFAYLTFALNYAVGGVDPLGYHLVNIGIHVASVLLVFALTRALFSTPAFSARRAAGGEAGQGLLETWAPFLAALLFACHPLHTQAVTYVTQRFASLAAALYLGAVLCHVRWRLGEERGRGLRLAAVALALLAMLTKELSATLPAVLLAIELVFFGATLRSAARRVWPYLATVAVIPLLMLYVSRRAGIASADDVIARRQHVAPPLDYLITQTTVVVKYLALLVWPAHLNFDYDHPLLRSFADPRVLASLALLLAGLGTGIALLVQARRRSSGPLAVMGFGILWFAVTLSVESSVVPIADLIEEYRCYLPSVGLVWTAVFAVLAAAERRPIAIRRTVLAAMGAAAALLAVATFERNAVYRDEVTLWEDVVAKSPLKPRPRINLSVAYANAGREEDSILQYQAAAYLNPDFRKAHGRLGVDQAEFEQVMRSAASSFARDHVAKGVAALRKGDLDVAQGELERALKLDPASADAHSALGFVLVRRRELDAAVRENREAVRIAPSRADLLTDLGLALYWDGKRAEAVESFRRALAIAPGDAEARQMLDRLTRR